MDLPKYLFVNDQRKSLSLEREKRKAAGTAQDTVGQPGIQIPTIANNTNRHQRET